MVTRRIAEALLRGAARRWPSEHLREWMAELGVLAAERKHVAMLCYAASLALSRPGVSSNQPSPTMRGAITSGRTWGTAATVLLAPLAGWVLALLGTLGALIVAAAWMAIFPQSDLGIHTSDRLMGFALLPITLILASGAALSAWRLGLNTILRGTVPLILTILLPVTGGLLYAELATRQEHLDGVVSGPYTSLISGIIMWAGCVGLVLIAAAGLRMRGRKVLAWVTGAVGVLLAADFAMILPSLQSPRSGEGPAMLLRLPALFIGQDSLHGWNGNYSVYMLICSGYALGYIIGAKGRALHPTRQRMARLYRRG